MDESPRFSELLRCLNEADVEYLIGGGYAVMKYGEPRRPRQICKPFRKERLFLLSNPVAP